MSKVVTYQDTRGGKINVCVRCEARLKERSEWPRNDRGEEYATVSYGLREGHCGIYEGHGHDHQ